MYTESKTITRKQLFDLVWSKPLRDIAPTLNLSDVGLAKLCDRNNIPRPPQGHWVRLQYAKPINKPTLRSAGVGIAEVIQLQVGKQSPASVSSIKSIPVSSTTRTHPLVVRCRKDFNGATQNEYGRLICATRKDLDVSRQNFSRALIFLNSVLHSLEEDGHTAQWSATKSQIEVCVDGESISLRVSETSTRSEHVLSHKEMQDKKRYGLLWRPRWDYTPSGKLTLTLFGVGLYGVRSSWSDGKKDALESNLPKILGGILRASEHMKQRREEDEKRELRWAVQERRRRRLDKAGKSFQQRVRAVDKLVADYQKASGIRACLDAMEKSGVIDSMPVSKRRLLRWADDLAQHLDPCCEFEFPALGSNSDSQNY